MNLLRNTLTVGGMTGLSRMLGFVRDTLFAHYLGAGPVMEAFAVAFRLPNTFRRISAEGAFAAAFLPMLRQRMADDDPLRAGLFANRVLTVMALALGVFCLLAILFMAPLVRLLAPGFSELPETFAMTVLFGRITFSYLFFITLTALISSMLNAGERFAVAASAPVLLNLVFVVGLSVAVPLTDAPGMVAALSVAIAGVLQLLWVLWDARRAGWRVGVHLRRTHDAIAPLLRRMGPGVIAAGGLQLNVLATTYLASQSQGANAQLFYADRIYQLPLGMIGIALGIVLMPRLSAQVAEGQREAMGATLNQALTFAAILIIPPTLVCTALPLPLVRGLFEHGDFDFATSQVVASLLAGYALGLPAFVMQKVFQPAYFAQGDTRRPMRYSLLGAALNLILAVILFRAVGVIGLALATSIAAWVTLAMLVLRLVQQGLWRPSRDLLGRALRALLASALMLLCLWGYWRLCAPLYEGSWLLAKLPLTLGFILGGILIYGLMALFCGAVRYSDRHLLARA